MISGFINYDAREDEREKARCPGIQQGSRSFVLVVLIKSYQGVV